MVEHPPARWRHNAWMTSGISQFDLSGQVAVVTGGSGVLGKAMAIGLAEAGAHVGVLARHAEVVDRAVKEVEEAAGTTGGRAEHGPAGLGLVADVLDTASLERARDMALDRWGRVDVLVNAAGGNRPAAVVPPGGTFFDLGPEATRAVIDLNLMGTFLPTQVFARPMASAGKGSIINISSMTSSAPMSRVAAYGAAKAAVDNLTRWLADHLARNVSPGIRVNAIAPGFFLGEQNRSMLVNQDGSFTERGAAVVSRTPIGRLGDPRDLVGTLVWLASDASQFVTGTTVPVDGGYLAAAGI